MPVIPRRFWLPCAACLLPRVRADLADTDQRGGRQARTRSAAGGCLAGRKRPLWYAGAGSAVPLPLAPVIAGLVGDCRVLVFRRQAIYSVSRLAPAMSKVKCTPDGALDMATRRIAFQSACPATRGGPVRCPTRSRVSCLDHRPPRSGLGCDREAGEPPVDLLAAR